MILFHRVICDKWIWLLIDCYNPHKDMTQNGLIGIGNKLNELSIKYENIILIGDFNSEICEDAMQEFCSTYSLKGLVKETACFKCSYNHVVLIN